MTISQYLGRGTNSRGSLSINGALNIFVSKAPYLQTQADTDVVIASIKNMQKAIAKLPSITFQVPAPGTSVEDYVASVCFLGNKNRCSTDDQLVAQDSCRSSRQPLDRNC